MTDQPDWFDKDIGEETQAVFDADAAERRWQEFTAACPEHLVKVLVSARDGDVGAAFHQDAITALSELKIENLPLFEQFIAYYRTAQKNVSSLRKQIEKRRRQIEQDRKAVDVVRRFDVKAAIARHRDRNALPVEDVKAALAERNVVPVASLGGKDWWCIKGFLVAFDRYGEDTVNKLIGAEKVIEIFASENGNANLSKARATLSRIIDQCPGITTIATIDAGIWPDIIHYGDAVVCRHTGKQIPFGRITYADGKAAVVVRSRLRIPKAKPATQACSRAIVKALQAIPWICQSMPWLALGWLGSACLAGALDWRPSIWIIGPSGAGKSLSFAIFSAALDGNTKSCHLSTSIGSTEAGIRQTIGSAAVPVLVDEAESANERTQQIITSIQDLGRVVSDAQASIVKGSSSHSAISFSPQCSFAFASIVDNLANDADRTRTVTLEIRQQERDPWPAIEPFLAQIMRMPPGAIHARMADHQHRIEPIRRLIAQRHRSGGGRWERSISLLLACAWIMTNDHDPVVPEDVENWLHDQVGFEFDQPDRTPDHQQALETMLGLAIPVTTSTDRTVLAPIGKLVHILAHAEHLVSEPDMPNIQSLAAKEALENYGIKIYQHGIIGWLAVHANNPQLTRAMPIAFSGRRLSEFLKRIPGAPSNAKMVRIGAKAYKCRLVPLDQINDPDEQDQA